MVPFIAPCGHNHAVGQGERHKNILEYIAGDNLEEIAVIALCIDPDNAFSGLHLASKISDKGVLQSRNGLPQRAAPVALHIAAVGAVFPYASPVREAQCRAEIFANLFEV